MKSEQSQGAGDRKVLAFWRSTLARLSQAVGSSLACQAMAEEKTMEH